MTTVVVIAKQCVPGRVKTRLTPPFTPEQAATLAHASLLDTLERADELSASRRVLAWDGDDPPEAPGWDVVSQSEGTLDERLAAVFDLCTGPTVLLGMDTPQFDPSSLHPLFSPWPRGLGAAIGHTPDGGFWALGMEVPRGDLIRGVGMSRDDTGSIQEARLVDAGLRVLRLPVINDVDTVEDALEVADIAPQTRFSRTLGTVRHEEWAR